MARCSMGRYGITVGAVLVIATFLSAGEVMNNTPPPSTGRDATRPDQATVGQGKIDGAPDKKAENLANEILGRVEPMATALVKRADTGRATFARATDFRSLVITSEWTETWPGADKKPEQRAVRGELWNRAI